VEARDLAALIKICPGGVRPNVEMRTLTTMKVGGRADVILEPASPEQIKDAIGFCEDKGIPWMVMGRGSNLIVKDGGIRGVVMKIGPRMSDLSCQPQKGKVEIIARAGLPLKRLLREAVRNGWGGLEFLAGIPGTMGGAVAMNAGGRDQAMGALVKEVTWLDGKGHLERKGARDLGFEYRSSGIPPGVVLVEVRLEAPIVPSEHAAKAMKERMEKRLKTQPLGCSSSGCIFKNPPGDSAGRLIEEAGLKGLRVGGAIVSHKHANFIINEGDARASHVLDLMELVRQKVARKTGVWLELEVKVVGEDG